MSEKITVLYVDDESINTMLFEALFSKKFNVLIAESGLEGLEILSENPEIKAVVSDMKMPGMNGIEFLTKVKLSFPDVYTYILSGFDISDEIDEAIKNKIILKFFRKPFNLDEIETSILQLVNNP